MSARLASYSGIATVVIWSLTSVALAMTGGVPPLMVASFSFLLAFFLTLGWWLYRGENVLKKFKMPLKNYALGIYGIFIYNTLYIFAFKTGPSLEVNLLNYTWPAFLIIFSSFLQSRSLDRTAMVGILCCCVGCYFVFKSRGAIDFSGSYLMLSLAILCGVMWGSYSTLSKYVSTRVDQLAIFFLIAGVLQLGLHLIFEETVWPRTGVEWAALVIYALSRGAFFLWDYALKNWKTKIVASLSYFIPLFSTLSLVFAGYATYSHDLFTGAALIIAGCIVINLKSIKQGFFPKYKDVPG